MPANFAWVRAKEGRRPIDPVRRDRLARGEWRKVENSPYWQRMAKDGDVELRQTDPATEPAAATEPADGTGASPPAGAAAAAGAGEAPGAAASGAPSAEDSTSRRRH